MCADLDLGPSAFSYMTARIKPCTCVRHISKQGLGGQLVVLWLWRGSDVRCTEETAALEVKSLQSTCGPTVVCLYCRQLVMRDMATMPW